MTHLFLGAFLISFSPLFVKLAAPYGVGGDAAAFHRVLIGGLGLYLATLLSREPRSRVSAMPREGYFWSLVCAVFFAGDLVTWHVSILYIGPGLATLFGNFQVFVLALWGVLFQKEKPSPRFFAGLTLAMAGLFAIVAPAWAGAGQDYQLGVVFGLLTGLFYAGFILGLGRSMVVCGEGSQLAVMTVNSLMTAALLLPVLLLRGESPALGLGMPLLLMAGYGLSSQLVGWALISRGLRETRVSLAGLVLLLQPALAYVWDLVFFARPAGVAELVGVAATLCGIALGVRRR
jgi:drug/metabolite transporter (DMT)-like permease